MVCFFSVVLSSLCLAKTPLKVGSIVPKLVLTDLQGKEFDLDKHLGENTVLLTFFTTWSKNCKAELAFLNELKTQYKKEKLEVIAISLDRKATDLDKFIKETKYDFTFLPNKKLKYLDAYRILIIPTLFVINKDGTLKSIYVDFDKNVEKKLTEDLKKIFTKTTNPKKLR